MTERASVAGKWMQEQKVSMPVALDDMNNTIDSDYSGAPERLYLIDKNGIRHPVPLTIRPLINGKSPSKNYSLNILKMRNRKLK